jgi:Helix-turn-helix domain
VGSPRNGQFLSPQEARTILGISRSYLQKLERQGKVSSIKDERGIHRYSRSEIAALALRRHVKVDRVHGTIAVQVFELFQAGMELPDIVIRTGQSPATIRSLWEEYKRPLDGETVKAHQARLLREQKEHDARMREVQRELETKLQRVK